MGDRIHMTERELALYKEARDCISGLTIEDDDLIVRAANVTVENALRMLDIVFSHIHKPTELGVDVCICGRDIRSNVHTRKVMEALSD